MTNLPFKTNVIYGVGMPANVDNIQEDSMYAKTALDIKQLLKLKNHFKLIGQRYETVKRLVSKRELNLTDYGDILIGIATQYMTRSSLTYTKRKDRLNLLGEHIKKIRNIVDYNSVLEVGTLTQYYSLGESLSDTLELTLKNYYTALNIPIFDTPKAKHDLVISKLGLDKVNWTEIYLTLNNISNKPDVIEIQNNTFISTENLTNLKSKFTLLDISVAEYEYFKQLQLKGYLKLADLFMNILQFDLIGSTIRFYLALFVESLLTISLTIDSLPDEVKYQPKTVFFESSTYNQYKLDILKYVRLALEISFMFHRFNIFQEMSILYKYLYKDYLMLSQYILDYKIDVEYSLTNYYGN